MTQGRLQCHAGYGSRDPQDTAQGRRYGHEHITLEIEMSPFLNEVQQKFVICDGFKILFVQHALLYLCFV